MFLQNGLFFLRWLVDPGGDRQFGRCGGLEDESLGVGGVGGAEGGGAGGLDGSGAVVVDVGGGIQAEAGVAVLVVVPGEEVLAPGAGLLDRGEPGRV